MELRQVKYFIKVAELNNYSEAARALSISQSTLSQQIRTLEDELGIQLFIRDSRHVSLSEYGEQFLPYAKQLIFDSDSCIERIRDVKALNVGTLNIGATFSFCPLLADTVRSFMKMYPGIQIQIFCSPMEDLMAMLGKGDIDIALSYKPTQRYENIESHILFSSKLCAVCSSDHELAPKESVRIAELEKYPMVLPTRGLQARNSFDNILFGQNYQFDVRAEINDLHVLLDLVSGSEFVTILSQTAASLVRKLKAIPLDHPETDMSGSYHLLKNSYCKRSTRFFLKHLIDNNSFNLQMAALEVKV